MLRVEARFDAFPVPRLQLRASGAGRVEFAECGAVSDEKQVLRISWLKRLAVYGRKNALIVFRA